MKYYLYNWSLKGISNMIKFEDLSDYDKGIFWGLGSFIDDRIVFRHTEYHFIDRMKKYVSNADYSQENKGKVQHVIKTKKIDINSFIEHGWTERNSDQRNVPILDDYKDFLRGYIELHSALKYSRRYSHGKKNPHRALKLIIYGNYIMMESINNILSANAGINKKTVQILSPNNNTASLDYTSLAEIEAIYNFIYGEPNNSCFWNEVYEKLKTPKIYD